LRIFVALSNAGLQVLGVPVVTTRQCHRASWVVAVVPVLAFSIPSASGNRFPILPLEAFQPGCALRIFVALSNAGLQVLGVPVVAAAQGCWFFVRFFPDNAWTHLEGSILAVACSPDGLANIEVSSSGMTETTEVVASSFLAR